MDSSIMEDSVFDAYGDSSDFSPAAVSKSKPKAAVKPKAAPKKAAAASKPAPKKAATKPKAAVPKKRAKPDSDDEADDLDRNSLHDDSLLSVTPPSAVKKQKTQGPATKTKKSSGKPLQTLQNDGASAELPSEDAPAKGAGKADKYQRLTQVEHILKRPDTYIGSVELSESKMWVFNSETDSMEMRDVKFVPGLYKIFDEILVNAADNKQNDKNMDAIKVTIDREKGEISVWNNGRGIPIEMHSKEKIYIPEMIFGHLLTSSNYDDEQQKVTGGRNGYGAKLCNIFSTEFHLETADSRTKQKYKQTWTENMSKMSKAKITANKSDDYTKITFLPDFTKFGMTGIDDDFEAIVKRRVYDIAGTSKGLKVSLNGERVKIRNFKQYVEMYAKAISKESGDGDAEPAANAVSTVITEQPNARWEIGFAVSDGSFQQVSFVNSIATTSGGTHVNYVCDQIVTKLLNHVNNKKKDKSIVQLKNHQIRNHIFLFVNCLITNPAFTSQTKEQLTTKVSQFGSTCSVSDAFLAKVYKTEVVANIKHFAQQKADQVLKKSDGHKRSRINNPKLTDANKAGTKDGYKCTLILTEGDSAKGLAMAGRSVVGPDEFGVFPLRGKLLNVRDASIDQISKNTEIQAIKQFLGLQHKKEYLDTKSLRYGHIMIMTDQDHDGSHIKGLLINFLQCAFPSLLKIPQFLIEFITPIVKVWKGDAKKPKQSKAFFTLPEYETWWETHKHEGWEYKYYKGLGTSTTEDAQIYFRDLDRHLKEFHTIQENEDKLIDLAFSKKKADERKEWLRQFKPGTFLDHSIDKITYTDFINKELILFSMADNLRSIPSVIDGLKPGQRKVLYTCFKRNLRKDVKVVELAGSVSSMTAYHHGEQSLQQTIVGLAQTFTGSNNVNCLEPSGNFGSRLGGGSDSASARYIYTRLSPFARRVFPQLDDAVLDYNMDDGQQIEPETYCPIVPMVLVNGADGIGTGWSSSIPNYNPEEIVANLRRLMKGEPQVPMIPWFRGWTGEVKQVAPDRYKFSGKIKQIGDSEVEITELPIRVWTQDFKEKIEDIIKAEKVPSFIKDYTDYNTHIRVHFNIQMEEKHMKAALEEGLEDRFKLSKTLATSNLVAFDAQGRLTRYSNVEEIMEAFYVHRQKLYEKRKMHQLAEMQKDLEKMTNRARFIQMIIDGKLIVSKKKKSVLVAELQAKNFKPFPKVKDNGKKDQEPEEDEDEQDDGGDVDASSYDYLLGMAIWSLTKERVDKLLQQIGDKELEIDTLIKLSVNDLWNRDLDAFLEEWRFQLGDDSKREKKVANLGRRASSKLKVGAKGPGAKKRKAMGDDPDDSDFGVSKPKKATGVTRVRPDADKGSSFFKQFSPPGKAAAAAQPVSKFGKPSVAAKPAAVPQALDGTSSSVPDDMQATAAAPASSAEVISEDSPARKSRNVARKPIKYVGSSDSNSDSDNGDDLLGDVSKMVKGIGGSAEGPKPGSRALFSTSTSRPLSGSRLSHVKGRQSTKPTIDVSDDETDFSKLVPQSPRKSTIAGKATEHVILDEDEDDSFSLAPPEPAVKAKEKLAAKPAAKPVAAAKAKKAAAVASTVTTKKSLLSTATKVPAAKQGKAKAAALDDDDDGVDDIANDLLDSPGHDELADSSPPRRAAARPARRTVATKKSKYVESESEEEASDDAQSDDFSESE